MRAAFALRILLIRWTGCMTALLCSIVSRFYVGSACFVESSPTFEG